MSEEKLKKCPFCGRQAGITERDYTMLNKKQKKEYRAACHNGRCTVSTETNWFDNPAEARAAWNRRAGRKPTCVVFCRVMVL
jgi:hypothetical protein